MKHTLTVPEHVGELTIEQFQAIHNSQDTIEQVAVACGVTREFVNQMDLPSLERVVEVMGQFDPDVDRKWGLVRKLEHEGVTYGFHPNLSEITVGEMADLETMLQDLYGNLVPIMSVLYRPIVEQHGDFYSIKPYTGAERLDTFHRVKMEVVLGALAFFLRCATAFVMNSRQSLTEVKAAR